MSFGFGQNISFQIATEVTKHDYGIYTFRITQLENGSILASVEHPRNVNKVDNVGALYYVISVILLYGCSILLMIASYIRRNNNDQRLNKYVKEMAFVRKHERRQYLMSARVKAARLNALNPQKAMDDNSRKISASAVKLSSASEVLHKEDVSCLDFESGCQFIHDQSSAKYQTNEKTFCHQNYTRQVSQWMYR